MVGFVSSRPADALVTFRVSRRRRDTKHMLATRVCVCVCLSLAACPHYCADPDVSWRNGRGCPVTAHCWADLQSVHGFRCYDNSAEREMSANACIRSIHGLFHCYKPDL